MNPSGPAVECRWGRPSRGHESSMGANSRALAAGRATIVRDKYNRIGRPVAGWDERRKRRGGIRDGILTIANLLY